VNIALFNAASIASASAVFGRDDGSAISATIHG
jgi:hypothetical protein